MTTGTVLYEQDNPGYIIFPIISDGKVDCGMTMTNAETRAVSSAGKKRSSYWRNGRKADRSWHLRDFFQSGEALEEFEQLPNHEIPKKVTIRFFHRNQAGARTTGERVEFLLPHVNVYSDNQVMFMAGEMAGITLSVG